MSMQGPTGLVTEVQPTRRRWNKQKTTRASTNSVHTFQTSIQSGSNYTSQTATIRTSSRLIGSGMVRVGDAIIANDVHHLLYRVDAHLLHSTPHTASSPPRLVRPLRSPVVDILQPALQPRIHEGPLLSLWEPLRGRWVGLAVQ